MESFNISDYLVKVDSGTGQCIRCNKIVGWAREKVAGHYRKCGSDDQKAFFKPMRSKSTISSNSGSEYESDNTESSTSDTMPAAKKQKFDTAVSQFIFNSGIPFRVIESSYFKKMIAVLNPAYANNIPCRNTLSSKLLDDEYDRLKKKVEKILSDTTSGLILISDGWTNVRKNHLVNFCVHVPNIGKTFFYKSIDTSEITQDAQQVADQLLDVINEIGREKFCGVVTDNAPVMQAAWKFVETEITHISANGCAAHCVNLLIEDIVKVSNRAKLLEDARKVIKFINNHTRVHSAFEIARKAANVRNCLSLPVITRWYTQLKSSKDLLSAKFVIRNLLDSRSELFTTEISRIIATNLFWSQLSAFVSLIEYPTNIIGKQI